MLTERGFVFVSTNYRLLPDVEMDVLIRDVAKSLGWVHKNIAKYGGDPKRIFVGGHSAGANSRLICIDDRSGKKRLFRYPGAPIDENDLPTEYVPIRHRSTSTGASQS